MFQWCMSFLHWAHLPCTDKSLSTCSNDVCPLYIELTYPGQINLSQHVPLMHVLSLSSPTLDRYISFNMFQWCMSFIHWAHLPWTDKSLSTCSSDGCPLYKLFVCIPLVQQKVSDNKYGFAVVYISSSYFHVLFLYILFVFGNWIHHWKSHMINSDNQCQVDISSRQFN